jgi:hypothetical protein
MNTAQQLQALKERASNPRAVTLPSGKVINCFDLVEAKIAGVNVGAMYVEQCRVTTRKAKAGTFRWRADGKVIALSDLLRRLPA